MTYVVDEKCIKCKHMDCVRFAQLIVSMRVKDVEYIQMNVLWCV